MLSRGFFMSGPGPAPGRQNGASRQPWIQPDGKTLWVLWDNETNAIIFDGMCDDLAAAGVREPDNYLNNLPVTPKMV